MRVCPFQIAGFGRIRVCQFVLLVAIVFLSGGRARSEESRIPLPREAFSWALEINEPYEGAADLSASLGRPAGVKGFAKGKGEGLFFEDGSTARFYGVNLASQSIFPEKSEAPREAARLASMGFNLVRFHFIDRGAPGGALAAPVKNIDQPVDDPWRIDPERLDQMFFFVAELKKRGIYVTHSLFGYANFMPADYARKDNRLNREHFPIIVKSWEQSFTNPYRVFFPPGITGFKGYMRELLTTRNPYTGLSLAEEPGVAFVEIANETGLVRGYGMSATEMPTPIKESFEALWLEYLKGKYPSDAALQTAWASSSSAGAIQFVPEIKEDVSSWTPSGNAQVVASTLLYLADATSAPAIRATFPDSESVQSGVWTPVSNPPVEGEKLRVSFRAKGDRPKLDVELVLVERRANETRDCSNRLSFTVGPETAEFAGEFTIRHAAGRPQFMVRAGAPGSILEIGSIKFEVVRGTGERTPMLLDPPPPPYLAQLRSIGPGAVADYYEFLFWLEKRFFQDIRTYLVNDLGVRQPVVGTAVHAQGGIFANEGMDLTNAHHYHPGSVLAGRSAPIDRVPPQAGKPHVMTELNSPNHPRASHEMVVLTASAAARQGFAGLCFFDYTHGTAHPRRIPNGIHLGWDPLFAALNVPARALFLRGDLPEAREEVLVRLNSADYIQAVIRNSNLLANLNLKALFGLEGRLYFLERIRSVFENSGPMGPLQSPPSGWESAVASSTDGTVRIDQSDPERPWISIATERTQGVVGAVGGKRIDLPGSSLSLETNALDAHAVFLTPLDDAALVESRSVIVSAIGHVANPLFPDRRIAPMGKRWSNEEFARPALIEGVEGKVTVQWKADASVRVYALDKLGRRRESIPVEASEDGWVRIPIKRIYRTLWYEIERGNPSNP